MRTPIRGILAVGVGGLVVGWAGDGAQRVRAGEADGRPPAMVDGAPVEWDELRPLLSEAAGSVVLEEIALGRALRAACRAEGLILTPAMIARERDELALAMNQTGLTQEETAALVQRVLASRGIGDARLQGLLERNAMLRALASRGLVATDEELREAHDVMHGERVRARIIVCGAVERAAAARTRIDAAVRAGAELTQAFAGEAKALSEDPSNARGGQLEIISVRDRRYSEALRAALATTSPGQMSGVFGFGGGWAVVLVESRVPPDEVALASARSEVERLVLARKERIRMQEIGESLTRSVSIEVSDPPLRWSWRTRTGATNGR